MWNHMMHSNESRTPRKNAQGYSNRQSVVIMCWFPLQYSASSLRPHDGYPASSAESSAMASGARYLANVCGNAFYNSEFWEAPHILTARSEPFIDSPEYVCYGQHLGETLSQIFGRIHRIYIDLISLHRVAWFRIACASTPFRVIRGPFSGQDLKRACFQMVCDRVSHNVLGRPWLSYQLHACDWPQRLLLLHINATWRNRGNNSYWSVSVRYKNN